MARHERNDCVTDATRSADNIIYFEVDLDLLLACGEKQTLATADFFF
jgi:hypothetical protein